MNIIYIWHIFQTFRLRGKMCNHKTPFRTCARCTVVVFFFCVQKCFECSDLDTEKTYLDIKQYGVYVPWYFRVMQTFYFNLNW